MSGVGKFSAQVAGIVVGLLLWRVVFDHWGWVGGVFLLMALLICWLALDAIERRL